jgi:hypothetical protein
VVHQSNRCYDSCKKGVRQVESMHVLEVSCTDEGSFIKYKKP